MLLSEHTGAGETWQEYLNNRCFLVDEKNGWRWYNNHSNGHYFVSPNDELSVVFGYRYIGTWMSVTNVSAEYVKELADKVFVM